MHYGTQNTRKKRHLKTNKRKKKKNKHVWLSGLPHIEGRLNEGPRLQRRKNVETKTKQNKTNVTAEKYVMTYLQIIKHPEDTISRHLWLEQGRANQHGRACFGLSSSWSFPLRSGIIRLHAVVQPWLSLQRSISP